MKRDTNNVIHLFDVRISLVSLNCSNCLASPPSKWMIHTKSSPHSSKVFHILFQLPHHGSVETILFPQFRSWFPLQLHKHYIHIIYVYTYYILWVYISTQKHILPVYLLYIYITIFQNVSFSPTSPRENGVTTVSTFWGFLFPPLEVTWRSWNPCWMKRLSILRWAGRIEPVKHHWNWIGRRWQKMTELQFSSCFGCSLELWL